MAFNLVLPANGITRRMILVGSDETLCPTQWKGLIGLLYLTGSMFLSLWGYTKRRWTRIADPGNLIGV